MRAVVQRVGEASVTVEQQHQASIGPGLLVYLGVARGDGEQDARRPGRGQPPLRLLLRRIDRYRRSGSSWRVSGLHEDSLGQRWPGVHTARFLKGLLTTKRSRYPATLPAGQGVQRLDHRVLGHVVAEDGPPQAGQ